MTTLTREEIQRLYGSSAYQVTDNDEVIIEADEFIGKLTGTADKAIALANPYTLKLIGDASGEITLNNTSKQMQVSVSHATNADNATHATSADNATRTTYCDLANIAHYAYRCGAAAVSNRSLVADNAITANSAIHADSADTATSASRATYDASGNAIDTTFASHNDRISSNATKNTQQDLRLDDLENYTELKEWRATTTYKKDKVVVYEDNLYRSKVNNNLNHLPTEQNSAYWKLLSETASGGTADCVHINDTETVLGDKTFTGLLIATTQEQSDNSQKVATTSFVHSAVNTLATNVYTKSETYNKTEINDLVTPKANNDSVVHLADAETITGNKTFSGQVNVPTVESSDNSTKVATTAFVKNITNNLSDINLSNISLQGKENILKYFSNIGTSERIEVIHNGIFRGENLMNYFNTMDDLYTAIAAGDFTNIYIGDYIEDTFTYGGTQYTTKFRVAGINSYYNYGDMALTQYHIVMVPDNTITEQMNTSDTTSGGYVGSRMYNTVLPALLAALAGTSGTPFYGHVIPHRELFVNAVSNGVSTDWAWYDNSICLMSEQEIFGHTVWSSSGYDRGYVNAQLPLFKLAPKYIATFNRTWHWLRSVFSATLLCYAHGDGGAYAIPASFTLGVRPRFLIG